MNEGFKGSSGQGFKNELDMLKRTILVVTLLIFT